MSERIYFISNGSAIKVGFTTNLASRLATLQTSSAAPLTVLGSIPGSMKQERAFHAELALYRLAGEWFEDCDYVRESIGRWLSGDLPESVTEDAPDRDLPKSILDAREALEIIVELTGASLKDRSETRFGIPISTAWALKYRPPKNIGADDYEAVMDTAVLTTDRAIERLAEQRAVMAERAGKFRKTAEVFEHCFSEIDRIRAKLDAVRGRAQ